MTSEQTLRAAPEAIKRKAFYHMVQYADGRGDRRVIGETKEMAIAALRETAE